MTTGRAIVATVVACSVFLAAVRGYCEVIGPQLPKGAFEIAVQNRSVDRSVYAEFGSTPELERQDLALVLRWGMTEFVTISFEGMTGPSEFVAGEADLQAFYLAGVGGQATLWRNERFLVTAAIQATRAYRRWNDTRRDEFDDSFALQTTVQSDFSVAQQTLTIFLGPAYSEETLVLVENLYSRRAELESVERWGGVIGAVALLGGHVTVNAQVFWVENPQPRFGIGYRF